MLLISIALCFFGMLLMFLYLIRGQDKVIKILNKKNTIFLEQLNQMESTLHMLYRAGVSTRQYANEDSFSVQPNTVSNRNNFQPGMQQGSPARTMQPSAPPNQTFRNGNQPPMQQSQPNRNTFPTQQPPMRNSDPMQQPPMRNSDNIMMEDVFPLQQDMIASTPYDNDAKQSEQRVDKGSMLELLQL